MVSVAPTFRDKVTAVTSAKDIGTYVDKYLEFVEAFGHGCATTVHLATGSAFQLSLQRTDDASTVRHKYGGCRLAEWPLRWWPRWCVSRRGLGRRAAANADARHEVVEIVVGSVF